MNSFDSPSDYPPSADQPASEHGTDQVSSPDRSAAEPSDSSGSPRKARWKPLTAYQRRVAGVLMEKARTTPDAYPMTLNGITTGCNQKSNRDPVLNLRQDQVEEILDELRGLGAVAEVHTGGRVPKYRHYMYDWLGVDKREMAVMTELLLRGEQTLGELRGRAARMEPIADVGELKEIVQGLMQRGLMIALSPPGRGQTVSHALYSDKEMEKLRQRGASAYQVSDEDSSEPMASPRRAESRTTAETQTEDRPTASGLRELDELRAEIESLRDQLRQFGDRLEHIESLIR